MMPTFSLPKEQFGQLVERYCVERRSHENPDGRITRTYPNGR
jgi:hypothetical protein